MRIIFAAVLIILLAATFWLPVLRPDLYLPDNFEFYRTIGFCLLGAWLLLEGFFSRRARNRLKALEQEKQRETDTAADARKNIEEKDQQLQAARQQLEELAAEQKELKSAFHDARAKLEATQREAKSQLGNATDQEVINFLGLLQNKGRFIDFIMDDVTKYADAQIGAAARVVHQGCAGVVREYFEITPVSEEAEGAKLTLGQDYDARRFKLLGRVGGEPPYTGTLLHRGWLTKTVRLPEPVNAGATAAAKGIIAPAEVELS